MTKFICSNIMYLFCFSSWNGNCSMLISTYQWTYSLHVLCITYVCTTCTVHIRSFQLQVLRTAKFFRLNISCQKTSWDSHLPQSLLLFYLRIFYVKRKKCRHPFYGIILQQVMLIDSLHFKLHYYSDMFICWVFPLQYSTTNFAFK